MFDNEAVAKEIQAARLHGVKIRNGAYFNARIAELADLFKPQCADQAERDLLRTRLSTSVDQERELSGQATAVLDHIAMVLSGN
jgi:beta-xylosidase